jgi:hypothetical protein
MFDNLPRHTLIRLTDGGVFLIKCRVMEYHSGSEIPCYLGLRYVTEVDCMTTRCYTNQIDSVIKEV